jgi:hypothetical protein
MWSNSRQDFSIQYRIALRTDRVICVEFTRERMELL